MLAQFYPARSSVVSKVAYDATNLILYVRFASGRSYAYFGAPPSDYWLLFHAEAAGRSVGRAFCTAVRPRYRSR